MLVESIAISMILVVMLFVFLRSHHRKYAIGTVPMLIVPVLNVLTAVLADTLQLNISKDILAAVIVFGLAVAVAAIGMLCTMVKSRKAKYAYLFLSGGFTTLLTVIFIGNIYMPQIIS